MKLWADLASDLERRSGRGTEDDAFTLEDRAPGKTTVSAGELVQHTVFPLAVPWWRQLENHAAGVWTTLASGVPPQGLRREITRTAKARQKN